MSVVSKKRYHMSSGRGGIPLNPEDEEEEGDYVRFWGTGNSDFVLRVIHHPLEKRGIIRMRSIT